MSHPILTSAAAGTQGSISCQVASLLLVTANEQAGTPVALMAQLERRLAPAGDKRHMPYQSQEL